MTEIKLNTDAVNIYLNVDVSLTPTPPVDDWILATGFWNDLGTWDDTSNWID